MVAVAGAVDGTESGSLVSLGSQFSSKTVVLFADPNRPDEPHPPVVPGTLLVEVDEPQGFAEAWTRMARG